jgi:hypothetical protein
VSKHFPVWVVSSVVFATIAIFSMPGSASADSQPGCGGDTACSQDYLPLLTPQPLGDVQLKQVATAYESAVYLTPGLQIESNTSTDAAAYSPPAGNYNLFLLGVGIMLTGLGGIGLTATLKFDNRQSQLAATALR